MIPLPLIRWIDFATLISKDSVSFYFFITKRENCIHAFAKSIS